MRKTIYIIVLLIALSHLSVIHAAYSPLNRRVWERDDAKREKVWGNYLYNPGYTTIQSTRYSGNRYSPDVYSVGAPVYMVSISRVTPTPTLLLGDKSGTISGNYGFGEVPHDNTAVPMDDGVVTLLLMALAVTVGRKYRQNTMDS